MGDKSPKNKTKKQSQRDAVSTQVKREKDTRQATLDRTPAKGK